MKEITHVERLNTIEKLTNEGFEGVDCNLGISLFEYGIAWKEIKETNEILFIYGIKKNNSGEYCAFDRVTLDKNLDVKKEFNRIKDWEYEVWVSSNYDEEYWENKDLTQKIYILFFTFGYENIFGTSYWEGFRIEE